MIHRFGSNSLSESVINQLKLNLFVHFKAYALQITIFSHFVVAFSRKNSSFCLTARHNLRKFLLISANTDILHL
jgi:hypothetical protein